MPAIENHHVETRTLRGQSLEGIEGIAMQQRDAAAIALRVTLRKVQRPAVTRPRTLRWPRRGAAQ